MDLREDVGGSEGPVRHSALGWCVGPGERWSQCCVPPPCSLGTQTLLNQGLFLSFHLGSRGLEPQAFAQAVAAAQLAFDMGTELGFQMRLLDIGGGFPGTEDTRARFKEVHGSCAWVSGQRVEGPWVWLLQRG